MITSKTNARTRRSLPGVALCALLLAVSLGTRAQSSPDPAQPLITDLPAAAVEEGVLGEPQLIEADVGTDEALSRIELFHRFDGETSFRRTPMSATDVPGVYAASVPTDGVGAERLEFYIVAEDEFGGTLVKGDAAEPLTRVLVAPPGAVGPRAERAEEASDEEGLLGGERKTYLYYALGALAVGAIAVAASGGGDDDSDESCGPDGCSLTLTLPPPAP